jgi:hypothetical protein
VPIAQDFTPKAYQTAAHDFLVKTPRANLYADPGLGKTATILWTIDTLGLEDVLVVAPRLVVDEVWRKEPLKWRQFQHLDVASLMGSPDARAIRALAPPRISVINFEQIIWLYLYYRDSWPFSTVIFDESPRLRGYRIQDSTRRALAIAQHAHTRVERWINLTGTPNANSYLDLWGPQWFIDGGIALGRSYTAMRDRWFYLEPSQKGYWRKLKMFKGAQEEIQQRMKATTFAVRARDYFDVKEPVERTVWIDLPDTVRRQYNTMQRAFYADLHEGRITAANCGVKALKLRQFSSGAIYYDAEKYSIVHEERLLALESMVEELSGSPLLIVVLFRHEREQILKRFKYAVDIEVPGAIEQWNEGNIAQLVLHAASGGHGLNLQWGGHHICFYSPYSDNELYTQVLERIGPVRQLQAGFDRPVYVHHIECRNTVDAVSRIARENRISDLEAFLEAVSELEQIP